MLLEKKARLFLLASAVVALGVAGAWHRKSRAEHLETAEIVAQASRVNPRDPHGSLSDELAPLARLRAHVAGLRASKDRLYPSTRDAYVAIVNDAFASLAKAQLELELHAVRPEDARSAETYNAAFERLQAYVSGAPKEDALPLARAWVRAIRPKEPPETIAPYLEDYLAETHGERDAALIAGVRAILTQAAPEDRQLYGLVREADATIAPITRRSIFGHTAFDAYVRSRSDPALVVRGAFTKAGWDTSVRAALADGRPGELALERRVLGEEPVPARDLRDRYFVAYTRAWAAFLADLKVKRPASGAEAERELAALNAPPWPYLELLRRVDENTKLDEAPRWVSPPERAFEPMVRFAFADVRPVPFLQYQDRIVADAVSQLARGDAKSVLVDATRLTNELMAPTQSGFTRPILAPLLLDPFQLDPSPSATLAASQEDWQDDVWNEWHDRLEDTYPFADTWREADVKDYADFFRPGGALFGFYDKMLKDSLDRVGTRYVPRPGTRYGGALVDCYERGLAIAEATFPAGATEPRVSLEVNLHGASGVVSEVTLDVDGASRTYGAPGPWLAVTWPATASPLVRMKVSGKDGLDEEILRPGAFAVFRFLDAATKLEVGTEGGKPAAPRCLVATYHLRSRPGVVQLDFRSSTNKALLASYVTRGQRLFAPYACPRDLYGR